MKITRVSFLNFSRIYSGLGKTSLTIDLTKMTNKIYLFVGENGSGKTSIMQSMHPFAYNIGTGDSTANSDLIIEKKDGRKEITIVHGNNEYQISHIYSRKKDDSLSVKSFIQKNGVELNESGTVRTFEDIVLSELGLDRAFLGLLSLGNTVDGFVKYTAANRKKFATQIFSQLTIYNKYYKMVSSKVRSTKSILANIATKLERYKTYDVDELELTRIELESTVDRLRTELSELSVNMGSTLQIIKDNEEFIADYDAKRSRFNELLHDIDALKGRISTQKDIVVLENDLASIRKNTEDARIVISGIESSIASELDLRDSKVSTMKSLQDTVSRTKKNTDLTELTELKASLEKDLMNITSQELPNRPNWSKEDLVKIHIYLDELFGMCVDLVNEVDDLSVVPTVLKDYFDNNDVDVKINQSLEELTYAYNQERTITLSKSLIKELKIRKISSSCKHTESCPYVNFYNTVLRIFKGNAEDNDLILQEKAKEIRKTEDMLKASIIIKKLYKFIDMNHEYFDLPEDLFDKNTFVLQYISNRTIYDESSLLNLIELEELYERKYEIETKLSDVTSKIEALDDTKKMYESMKTEITQLEVGIQDIDHMIEHQRNDLEYNQKKLDELYSVQTSVEKQLELLRQLSELRNEFNSVKTELASMDFKISNIQQARTSYEIYERKRIQTETSINEAERKLKSTQMIITTIEDLKSEQRSLMDKYSKDKLILEAVSPTEGIPIDFINYYIKEVLIDKVNVLLDTVYHGKLRLLKSKTVIDDTEFTIPYLKRNTVVKDISNASDGEKAIMSLAFSLVLLNITAGPYNILLLDEMDTTLDTVSRAKYIDLLEQFMNTIKAEQLFLISHNSMWDMYPVNVLRTSDVTVNVNKDSNVLNLAA